VKLHLKARLCRAYYIQLVQARIYYYVTGAQSAPLYSLYPSCTNILCRAIAPVSLKLKQKLIINPPPPAPPPPLQSTIQIYSTVIATRGQDFSYAFVRGHEIQKNVQSTCNRRRSFFTRFIILCFPNKLESTDALRIFSFPLLLPINYFHLRARIYHKFFRPTRTRTRRRMHTRYRSLPTYRKCIRMSRKSRMPEMTYIRDN
jgi:hypothetical protein